MAEEQKNITENPIYLRVKDELNEVGSGMCLAKWTQVTLQLQSGHNHSCHHPRTHKISETEIARNPSALHNTRYKKLRRKEMLQGSRPTECDYCWNVEDNSDRFSDRIFKSGESWSYPFMKEIVESDWREDYNPKYVEVAFSNACNFKCSYCGPAFSSTWVEEVEQYGGYPTLDGFNSPEWLVKEDKMPIPYKDANPYVDAFWKWWPELYKDLHTFRITGGEPLMSKDTWKVLDYIIDHPNPNTELKLAFNSNLGVPDALIDKFIEKLKRIEDGNKAKEIVIFTSCDTWGEQAEYIRTGLEFNRFWNNVNKILTACPRIIVTFMSTYNALSLFNYEKKILIKELTLDLKLGYYDFEKEKPQKVKFSLEIDYEDKKPTSDKDIKSIVNYGQVVKLIKKLTKNKHYNFLETLAEDVFDVLFKDKRIGKIMLQIEKLEILKECTSVGIQITKKRSHEKL